MANKDINCIKVVFAKNVLINGWQTVEKRTYYNIEMVYKHFSARFGKFIIYIELLVVELAELSRF